MGLFVGINNMTRIIIQPNLSAQNEMIPNKRSLDNQLNYSEYWTGCFQVEFFHSKNQKSHNLCLNLTSVEVNQTKDSSLKEKFGAKREPYQYLASIQAIRTPMQTMKVKDSSMNSMKKFLQSIENSYTEKFYDMGNFNDLVYALLTIDEEDLDLQLRGSSDTTFNSGLKLRMSQFLRNQLKLFEISPKVMIKASSVLSKENKILLSNTTKKRLKLKTNYDKNV